MWRRSPGAHRARTHAVTRHGQPGASMHRTSRNPCSHLPGRLVGSGAGPKVATPARATGRAVVAPVAGCSARATAAHARATAVTGLRADAGAAWRARRRRATHKPVVAGVERARGATTPDVRAVEPRARPNRQRGNKERACCSCNRTQGSASSLARCHCTYGRVEPFTVHRCTPHRLVKFPGGEGPLLTLPVTRSADKP